MVGVGMSMSGWVVVALAVVGLVGGGVGWWVDWVAGLRLWRGWVRGWVRGRVPAPGTAGRRFSQRGGRFLYGRRSDLTPVLRAVGVRRCRRRAGTGSS